MIVPGRPMMRTLRNVAQCAVVAALPGCGMVATASAESGPPPRSTNLEIIVKFSDASDAGQEVQRTLDQQPQDSSTLAALRDRLYRSTGFVLIPERVTSGAELIVRVSERPLLETVMNTVTGKEEVSGAKLVESQQQNPRLPQALLLLHFREYSDEAVLLAKAYGDQAYAGRVQALTTKLCAESGVPVLGNPETASVLAVTVDRHALLRTLVSQLNDLDYVDYAQPNSTVQFMNQ